MLTADQRSKLLAQVPDEPVWIEARAALLDSEGGIYGDERGFVARSDSLRLAGIVGRASEEVIRAALANIEMSSVGGQWAVVAPGGVTPAVGAAMSGMAGWRQANADVFLEPESGLRVSPSTAGVAVEWLDANRGALVDDLPPELADELRLALERTKVAAAWVDGRPVSFCYVPCESETLWDISISTLDGYRRRGLAAATVHWLAGIQRDRGKHAVWGAHSHNTPSRRLARKLGFVWSGRLELFEN